MLIIIPFIDKYNSVLICFLLAVYILNSIYIGSHLLSIILFILVITLQTINLRKQIKRMSLVQLLLITGVIAFALSGLVVCLMLLSYLIKVDILDLPDWLISTAQIVLIFGFLIGASAVVQSLFKRFTSTKI